MKRDSEVTCAGVTMPKKNPESQNMKIIMSN